MNIDPYRPPEAETAVPPKERLLESRWVRHAAILSLVSAAVLLLACGSVLWLLLGAKKLPPDNIFAYWFAIAILLPVALLFLLRGIQLLRKRFKAVRSLAWAHALTALMATANTYLARSSPIGVSFCAFDLLVHAGALVLLMMVWKEHEDEEIRLKEAQ